MKFLFSLLLLGISGIFTINSAYALEVNHGSIDLSESYFADLTITGDINDYQSFSRLILTIVSPDGSTNDYDVRVDGEGAFSETFTITKDWMYGKYTVNGNYGDLDLGSTFFVIEEPYDPRVGMTTVSKSAEITTESVGAENIENIVVSTEIPEWVRNTALWYGQRSISETEFINAIKFLIENRVIVVDTSVISESASTSEPAPKTTKVFPDPDVDPQTYVDRYLNEQLYREWFERNYPGKTIYEIVGLPEPTPTIVEETVITQPAEPTPTIVEETVTIQPADSRSITNSNFAPVFSNPDDFTGQWAKLHGEVTQKPFIDENNMEIVFDISQNEVDFFNQKVWFVSDNPNLDIKSDDCFILEGPIKGKSGAENVFGASRDVPLIALEKISSISCLDAKYPAFKTLTINESQIKGNIKLTLHEIQFSEDHTRALVEIENLDSSQGITFYSWNANILQEKSQFPAESSLYGVDYQRIESEIPRNIVEKGFVFFDPVNEGSFKILFESTDMGHSWEDIMTYTFEFDVN